MTGADQHCNGCHNIAHKRPCARYGGTRRCPQDLLPHSEEGVTFATLIPVILSSRISTGMDVPQIDQTAAQRVAVNAGIAPEIADLFVSIAARSFETAMRDQASGGV